LGFLFIALDWVSADSSSKILTPKYQGQIIFTFVRVWRFVLGVFNLLS